MSVENKLVILGLIQELGLWVYAEGELIPNSDGATQCIIVLGCSWSSRVVHKLHGRNSRPA